MRGFLNSLKLKPMVVKHIVLGQCVESYRPTLLNNFLNYVRRYYGEIVYVWTVEVQGKRLEKYGEAVLHWHLLIAFEWGTEFTKDDILRLQRYWKYGRCDVIPVRSVNTRYLLKYITKALNSPVESIFQVKRISTSRIEGWLKQSWNRILQAYDWFKKWYSEKGIDALSDFYWSNGNAYLYEEEDFLGVKLKRRTLIYRKRPSGWYKMDAYCGEPF